jgi:hypothetical protein
MYVEARYAQGGARPDTTEDYHKLHCYDLSRMDRKAKIVDYREPEFDYRAFPLGYMNYNNNAHYLVRIPYRIQKQGLCRHAINCDPHIGGSDWYTSAGMRDTILNVYPKLAEALVQIEDGEARSVAVHRTFAISNTRPISLSYKGRVIGYMEKNYKFRLLDNKEADAITMMINDAFKGELCLVK